MSTLTENVSFDHGAEEHSTDLYRPAKIARGVDGFDAVTDNEIRQYNEQGFMIVHGLFSEREVEDSMNGLLHLIAGGNPDFQNVSFEARSRERLDELTPDQRQDAVRKLMRFCDFDERLKAMSEHPKLQNLLHRILNSNPRTYQEMALVKPPRIGREKPWHQDHAYFKIPTDEKCIGVWIALDEATIENGCMHIMPHRYGSPILHFQRRDWQICDTQTLPEHCLAVPLKPGDCLFFSSLLPHGTPTNRSEKRRRALQFHYVREDLKQMDEVEHKQLFGGEFVGQEC